MAKTLQVLIIDDNPDDRVLILRELRHEFPDLEAEEPIDSRDLEDALQRHKFDLAITDFQIRWTDGITVLKAVKSHFPDCPVIMFTGTGNEEVAVEAMKVGLDYYVVKKPSHFVRLRTAARTVLALSQERIRSAQLEARLQTLLGQLNVGVFRCTRERILLDANEAFLNLLGIDSENARESQEILNEFFQLEGCLKLFDRLENNRTQQDVEVLWSGLKEVPVWIRLSGTLSTSPDNQTVIDGIIEDITKRVMAEEQRRQRAVVGARFSLLSPREREVFDLVVTGKTNKAIAHHLDISPKTVEMHRSNVMKKLRVGNVADLVRLALASKPPNGFS